jgi:3-isopropylmalate dehydrogenase
MLLRWSLNQGEAAETIEEAVSKVLASGLRTADVAIDGQAPVGTRAMTDAVLAALS